MRKFDRRKLVKRLISVVLTIAMVLAMVPFASKKMVAQADIGNGMKEYFVPGGTKVVRGVVDNITELPQYGVSNWKSLTRGKSERPFVFLEITPYEEWGEFGYMISGCEPLNVEKAFSSGLGYQLRGMNCFTVEENKTSYFFNDEEEGKASNYGRVYWDNYMLSSSVTVDGYYEVVPNTTGDFAFDETNKKIVVKDGGNLKWHSMQSYMVGYSDHAYEYEEGFDPVAYAIENETMKTLGNRLYMQRKATEEDKAVNPNTNNANNYMYIKNDDVFLNDVLNLKGEKREQYSIVYKAITPEKLNSVSDWIEYADFIYINSYFHADPQLNNFGSYWVQYNRLGRTALTAGCANATDDKRGFLNRDLSCEVIKKIITKVSEETNYAAIMIDNALYESSIKPNACNSAQVTVDLLDYNLEKLNKYNTYQEMGYDGNLYKLMLMLVSVSPNIARDVFLPYITAGNGGADEKNPDKKAKLTIQNSTGNGGKNAQMYWTQHELQLVDRNEFNTYMDSLDQNANKDPLSAYLTLNSIVKMGATDEDGNVLKDGKWSKYGYSLNFNTNRVFVKGRVFTYNGNNSISKELRGVAQGSGTSDPVVAAYVEGFNETFYEFDHYVQTDVDTRQIWLDLRKGTKTEEDYKSKITGKSAPVSAALRYILGLGADDDPNKFGGNLNILVVEPATSLNSSADPLNKNRTYLPKWKVKSSLFYMMLPDYVGGNITLTHMTMNTFVGKIDDLNSTFDMIYLGADLSGFKQNPTTKVKPYFNGDPEMTDGWIYFHIGSRVKANLGTYGNDHGLKTVDFIDGKTTEFGRLPGNDITIVKKNDLIEFMKAGFPIVADGLLYTEGRIDPHANMYNFLTTYDADNNPSGVKGGIYEASQWKDIEKHLKDYRIDVTFLKTPTPYDEVHYLDKDATGTCSVIDWRFKVGDGEYYYKVYVDQNKNAKFETDEYIADGTVTSKEMYGSYTLSEEMVGLIQWRIEVYRKGNRECRKSIEGCSAAELPSGRKPELIRVLQIEPYGDNDYPNCIDLSNQYFKAMYSSLNAYTIIVDQITWGDFEKYFETAKFQFDMSKDVNISDNDAAFVNMRNASTTPSGKTFTRALITSWDSSLDAKLGVTSDPTYEQNYKDLLDYDMFILGFADMYGHTCMNNDYGAVEFLYYYSLSKKGGSLLFTHDTTSQYNDTTDNTKYTIKDVYGMTANTLLRDVMGNNRYGVTSKQLSVAANNFRDKLKEQIEGYRSRRISEGLLYDTIAEDDNRKEIQGFTFGCYKKLGADNGFYYLTEMGTMNTGQNGYTRTAKRLNVGQITEYPYNIKDDELLDGELHILKTHTQLYQLNMEDPELTVWYTLVYNNFDANSDSTWTKSYLAASPEDAANTYYIYSKGRIFYSGVGHSEKKEKFNGASSQPVMERKLFVNTMIAAYKAKSVPPRVKVTNEERIEMGGYKYAINIPQEFNYDKDDDKSETVDFDEDYVTVYFQPFDSSFSTNLMCRIRYNGYDINADNSILSVTQVGDEGDGTVFSAKTTDEDGNELPLAECYYIHGLRHGHTYSFRYPKELLKDKNEIIFECRNAGTPVEYPGITILDMMKQPLFLLD